MDHYVGQKFWNLGEKPALPEYLCIGCAVLVLDDRSAKPKRRPDNHLHGYAQPKTSRERLFRMGDAETRHLIFP